VREEFAVPGPLPRHLDVVAELHGVDVLPGHEEEVVDNELKPWATSVPVLTVRLSGLNSLRRHGEFR